MKVYLAAPFSWKTEIKKYRAELERNKITCVSTWLDEECSPNTKLSDISDNYSQNCALVDMNDIDICDVFILFTVSPEKPVVRGGRHFESGYAMALDKELVIVGPKENIFHYLPDVRQFNTWEECREWLKKRKTELLSGISLKPITTKVRTLSCQEID